MNEWFVPGEECETLQRH